MLVGIKDNEGYTEYDIEYSGLPYGGALEDIRRRLAAADVVIGANIKFDIRWIKRYIPDAVFPRVFDTQLCEFLVGNMVEPYPSLDKSCERRGLGNKYDVVKLEYWDRGIDTPDVPLEILSAYLRRDVELTEALFQRQRHEFASVAQKRLYVMMCEDLLILQEMEHNGMLYDTVKAQQMGEQCRESIRTIDEHLVKLADSNLIDWGSDDHISALLYGGSIPVKYRETYQRTLKNGTVKEYTRWAIRDERFERLVAPLRRTETKPTAGMDADEFERVNREREEAGKTRYRRYYSVAEPVLSKLKCKGKARQIIDLMLERSKLEKLDSTYYSGLVAKCVSQGWEGGILHGQFNQSVARTGRLTSSGPNLQNFSGEIKELFGSRVV